MKAKRRKSTAFEERAGIAPREEKRASDYTDTEKEMMWDMLHSIQDRLGNMEAIKDRLGKIESSIADVSEKELKEKAEREKREEEEYIKTLLQS